MRFWNTVPGFDVGEFVGGAEGAASSAPTGGLDAGAIAEQTADVEPDARVSALPEGGDEVSMEALIQEELARQRAAEAGEGVKGGKGEGEAESAADPTVETPAETPAEPERDSFGRTETEYTELGKTWTEMYAKTPEKAAATLLQAMTPEQRAAALALAGMEVGSSEFRVPSSESPNAEPKTLDFTVTEADQERFSKDGQFLTDTEIRFEKNRPLFESMAQTLETSRDWIENGAAHVEQYVQQALTEMDSQLTPSLIAAEVAAVQVEIALEALGLKLPAVDQAKLFEAVGQGKTFSEAIRAQIGPEAKKAMERKAQAEKGRPNTPGPESGSDGLPANASLYDMIQAARNGAPI